MKFNTKIGSLQRLLNKIFILELTFASSSAGKNVAKYSKFQIVLTFMHKSQDIEDI